MRCGTVGWPAVVLFLEATALPSPFAVLFLILDAIVFIALVRHRDWFERARPGPTGDARTRSTVDGPPR